MPESLDAFGRLRVSTPETIFDSKQLNDNQPLFWDDQEESGADTTSTFDADEASSVLGVAAATAGKRTRQTFQRFNYHPGKSHVVYMTGTLTKSGGGAGITSAFGYFDDDNGIFFRNAEGTLQMCVRTNFTGTPVDTVIPQSQWNVDTLDGSGGNSNPSFKLLDVTKSQLFMIDFEWLGSGQVRVGFKIAGRDYYVHEFKFANVLEGPYMSTPNLPLRYQIENSGAGAASTMRHTCCTVMSEGGIDRTGVVRHKGTGGVHVDANVADTLYAVVGVRLKAAYLDCLSEIVDISLVSETNDDFEWILIHNPSVAGTFTYGDVTNSCMQTALGATANVVTNGIHLDGGFSKSDTSVSQISPSSLELGAAIDGTRDTIVLCVRPLSANANIQGSLTWREFS